MKKEVQLTVEGKVFRPNRKKVLALNRCLEEYSGAVEWYLNFNSTSKTFLHKNGYERAKQLFNLNTALIQTARDKAVGAVNSPNSQMKSWRKVRMEREKLRP